MKKIIFYLLVTSIISCNSNDEITTAIDENLPQIKEKLDILKTNSLNQLQDNSLNKNSKKSKTNFCNHEESDEFYHNGATIEVTTKYFDRNKKPITNCDFSNISSSNQNNSQFYLEHTTTTTGVNYLHTSNQLSKYNINLRIFNNSFSLDQKVNSEVNGVLNFDGDEFNIIEGSYVKIHIKIDSNQLSEKTNSNTQIDIKYIIEFDVLGEKYHFKMLVDYSEIIRKMSKTELDYDLLNSKNQKVGTVSYLRNPDNGDESFILKDLNGQLIE